jgi:hypothetical protein
MAGRPLKFGNVEELEKKIEEYFATTGWQQREVYNKKKGEVQMVPVYEPATVTGLAVFLDTSRETLVNYEEKKEYFDAIKKAKDRCEHSLEYGATLGEINPIWAIFASKNNYGWRDKTEQDITSGGKPLPILGNVLIHDSNKEGIEPQEEN